MSVQIFFDTNVILDALTERDTGYEPSRELIRRAALGEIKGFIASKQITDIYFSLRKYCQTEAQRKAIINTILATFEVLPTLRSDIAYSMNSAIPDLEDALIDEMCAVHGVPHLVTNNAKDFRNSKATVWKPSQILEILETGDQR